MQALDLQNVCVVLYVPQFWYDSLLNELQFNDFTVFSLYMH